MKKIISIIAVLVLVGIAVFFFLGRSTKITNFPPQGKTIIAFGDSLVSGVGATEDKNFVSRLEKLSGQLIINLGVPGNTSVDGLARVNAAVTLDPKIVLLLLGGNDFLRKVPVDETFKNLDQIVATFQNSGAVVILLGIRGGILSDQYENRFEDLAEERGTLYVSNVLSGLLGHDEFMSDTIHPNDAGYAKIAERVLPKLLKALGH